MKNYIFVHLYNDYSGSPRVLKDLVNILKNEEKNAKFHIITSESSGILDTVAWDSESRFQYKPKNNKILKLLHYILSQIKIFNYTTRLVKKLEQNKEDETTVIINTMLPFGANIAVCILKPRNVINYIHESYIKPKVLKSFLRKTISYNSGKIIFVSKYLMKEEFFLNKEQYVIHNPISDDVINHSSNSKIKNSIVMLSSLLDYKGIDKFILLSKYFELHKFPLKFTLVLNSNEYEFNQYLIEKKLTLGNNLIILYKPNNISDIYYNSGFVINLTDHNRCIETFGLTLVEGMANGCIPIAPNYGGPKEIIDSSFGYLYNSFNCQDIFNFIKTTLSENKYDLYSEQSKLNSKFFNLDSYRKKILNIINI
ncbi:TPA: glycosyltransferase [Escherichia coli]|uniref:glycosyltransferase n=1 Tax=Escherichia coli TaxID=562 RepID=UPI001868312A|nr:glycosyltransferase [Escherichia coli]HCJ9453891.1 glycosyltransferase [Escherichia coli]